MLASSPVEQRDGWAGAERAARAVVASKGACDKKPGEHSGRTDAPAAKLPVVDRLSDVGTLYSTRRQRPNDYESAKQLRNPRPCMFACPLNFGQFES